MFPDVVHYKKLTQLSRRSILKACFMQSVVQNAFLHILVRTHRSILKFVIIAFGKAVLRSKKCHYWVGLATGIFERIHYVLFFTGINRTWYFEVFRFFRRVFWGCSILPDVNLKNYIKNHSVTVDQVHTIIFGWLVYVFKKYWNLKRDNPLSCYVAP